MIIEKTEAIVLSSKTYSEADIISTLFTRDDGIGTFIFKGLKKSKRREQGATQTGASISLSYYKGHSQEPKPYFVRDFNLLTYPLAAINSYEQSAHALYVVETVLRTTPYHTPFEYVYLLLLEALKRMTLTAKPIFLSLFFTLHLLKKQGVLPSTAERLQLELDKISSHLQIKVCHNDFFNEALSRKFSEMDETKYSAGDMEDFLFYLVLYIEHYYTIDLKTKKTLF